MMNDAVPSRNRMSLSTINLYAVSEQINNSCAVKITTRSRDN